MDILLAKQSGVQTNKTVHLCMHQLPTFNFFEKNLQVDILDHVETYPETELFNTKLTLVNARDL